MPGRIKRHGFGGVPRHMLPKRPSLKEEALKLKSEGKSREEAARKLEGLLIGSAKEDFSGEPDLHEIKKTVERMLEKVWKK